MPIPTKPIMLVVLSATVGAEVYRLPVQLSSDTAVAGIETDSTEIAGLRLRLFH